MLNDAVASDSPVRGGGGGGAGLSEPLLPPPSPPRQPPPDDDAARPRNGGARDGDSPSPGDGGGAAMTLPLLLSVLASSISQFLLGYNTGVMNAPHDVVFPNHGTAAWSAAVAVFALGGAAGAALGGPLADGCGRRGAALVAAGLFVVGGTVQSLAPSMLWVGAGRLVVGVASGAASTFGPVHLREIAPPSLSGALGTVTQLSITTGILAADLLAFPWATPEGWRRLFGVTAALAGVQLVLSPLVAESPRWMLTRDRTSKEAREALRRVRGLRSDEEAERAAQEVLREIDRDSSSAGGTDGDAEDGDAAPGAAAGASGGRDGGGRKAGVRELFRDPSVRLPLVTALVVPAAQQLCGINAVFYYSTMFFDGIVSNPLVGTAAVASVNVLFTLAALGLMDRCGRRTLIMASSGGMFVCCVVVVLSLLGAFPNVVALAAVNLYVAAFNLGLGPVPFLIVPELFGHEYVATAVSVSLFANWVCNFAIGLTFPFLHEHLGAYSFGPFALVLLGTFAFAWGWMPETGKGGGAGGRGGGEGEEEEEQGLVEPCDGSII